MLSNSKKWIEQVLEIHSIHFSPRNVLQENKTVTEINRLYLLKLLKILHLFSSKSNAIS